MHAKMSDDITVTSLNPDDDDPSSPSSTYNNLMASLAEHSYCASVISSSTEPVITDLFEITSSETLELGSDVTSSISFPVGMGDVNLDGLDYPVPSVAINGNGNTTELENVWTGLSGDTNTTVVEIAATSSMDEREEIEEYTGSDEQSSFPPAKKSRRSNCRRKDFIQDSKKRKDYFDLYYNKLISQIYRIRCRAGCESSVSISFEGKIYDCEGKTANLTRGPLREDDDAKEASNNESKSYEMEDHRYAATMLTQNVQSPTVRDHQYDEKTATECDEDADIKRPQNRYKYDYIKLRWDRDQTFGRLVKSLFFSKIILEQRTGASIKISLDYEGCVITEDNYESANNAIMAHRNHLKYKAFNLAPAPQKVSVQLNTQNLSSTPMTFILPANYFSPLHVLPSSPGSSMSSVQDISSTAETNDFQNPNRVATFSLLKNMQVKPTEENSDNPSIIIPFENEQDTVGEVIMDGNNILTSCASSPGFSPPEEVGDISELLVFPNSSSQNSPAEMTATMSREMKDSSTNTEPICSICSTSCAKSTLTSHGRTGVENSSKKAFWIRCNDPFCFDVVHASCVGFVVTHNSHLKQLPAFYCKLHR